MKRLFVALLVVGVALAGAPMSVSAQEDGGVLDGIFDEDDDTSAFDTLVAGADGTFNKVTWWASNYDPLSDAEEDRQKAEQDRADLQQTFNANNASIENYTNARFSGNASEWDVIEIAHTRDDGTTTQYLVADAENSTFSNAHMVNSTERAVDHELTISGVASDSAHEELQTFVDEFVATDTDVTTTYGARLATEYSGYLDRPEVFKDE